MEEDILNSSPSVMFRGTLCSRLYIYYFNCEHFLFVYNVKQKQTSSLILQKKIRGFSKFKENRICWRQFLKF